MTNLIVETYHYKSFIAGDILRKERNSGSELGKSIAAIIDKGNLVPDNMVTKMIRNELGNIPNDFEYDIILDGYPRSIQQAIDLDTMVHVDLAIYLKCDEEVLIKRIVERGKTSGRPDDSDESIIRSRMNNYWEITDPVKGYYKTKGIYFEVDADKEIPLVYNDIKERI